VSGVSSSIDSNRRWYADWWLYIYEEGWLENDVFIGDEFKVMGVIKYIIN